MWSDNETSLDFLNYTDTVELVTSTLLQEHIRPISLGLFGGWGVGKSSLMNMVINEISKDEKNLVLHFDAWLFQDYDNARASLLQKIGDTLYQKAKTDEALKTRVIALYKRIDKLRVIGLLAEGAAFAAGVPTFGTIARGVEGSRNVLTGKGDAEDITAIKTSVADIKDRASELLGPEENNSPPHQIEAFRSELKSILESLDCTLFVFIDNLDRCLPDKAIHTLEAVRLFLFMERTAFVIAADEDMIRLAVKQHYKADAERLVTDYLDKLVQIPVRVPRTGIAELRAFLILLLTSQPLKDEGKLREHVGPELKKFLLSRLQLIWDQPFPDVEEILTAMKPQALLRNEIDAIREVTELAKRIAPMLVNSPRVNGNPRIVKRMLNTMRMRQMMAARRGITLSEEAITKLALFERCAGEKPTNDLMTLIMQSSSGKVSLLKDLEDGNQISDIDGIPESWIAQEAFITEWCKISPKLGQLNLKAAAYLSRETQAVFSPSDGLSIATERAVSVLVKAVKTSDKSTREAIETIPKEDRSLAMEELNRHLSNVSSWTKRPDGWAGALALADKDDSSAKLLAAFIRSRNLPKVPPWMAIGLKDKTWWEG